MIILALFATLGAATSPLTLNYVGAGQNFVIPANVNSLNVTLYAGSGIGKTSAPGGKGSMISSNIPVIPGQVLLVMVGSTGSGRSGGYNGGGNGAEIGGGDRKSTRLNSSHNLGWY